MSEINMPEETSWVQVNRKYNSHENNEKSQRNITIKNILCNRITKGWIFLTIFAASVPILVYYFVIDKGTYTTNDSYTCLVERAFRVPCGDVNITANDCKNVKCCFDRSTNVCYHYLPSKYSYDIDKETKEYIAAQSKTPYNTFSLRKLHISINELNENKVNVILSQENQNIADHYINTEKNYKVRLIEEKLMVEIYRSNDELLLSTTKGPLIASENYWEWSFYLTNHSLFGLNRTLIDVPENSTFTKVIYKNKVDHSTLPVLWAYNNKKFHGVVIKHDGPLEIVVLPSNMVILKSLTGGLLELELSIGPTPKLLHDQQVLEGPLPPPWALGTHMCRRGNGLNLTELLLDYNLDSQADSDCIHENLVMSIMKDDKENLKQIRSLVKDIKEQGSRFLLSVPPHVLQSFDGLYNKLVELDVLFKYNNSIYAGQYLDETVVYPDYSHPNIQYYIEEFCALLNTYMDINDIDGFVFHDNWPVNEIYLMNNTHFPYISKGLQEAMSFTLPWNSTANKGFSLHIQEHNAYGANQILSFQNYLSNITNHDTFIMSASKTFGQTQPSIIQNINTSWTELDMQIDNVLFNSVFGNHLVSFPVCGDSISFQNYLQEILCLRWYLVAATMPMFRISSYKPWRDHKHLNTTFAQDAALRALTNRKILLPHYYTLLSRNEPVVRPMFYDYFENETTFSLKNQYMIGNSLLVAHPFSTGRTRLQIYLPNNIVIWYELWGGQLYNSTKDSWINFHIVETDFIAFVSQGSIIPLKDENILNLIIALNCSMTPCEAKGTLFDYSYINFLSNETALTIIDIPENECNYVLGNINLYFYENGYGTKKHFTKNEDLCTSKMNVTIVF